VKINNCKYEYQKWPQAYNQMAFWSNAHFRKKIAGLEGDDLSTLKN